MCHVKDYTSPGVCTDNNRGELSIGMNTDNTHAATICAKRNLTKICAKGNPQIKVLPSLVLSTFQKTKNKTKKQTNTQAYFQ